MTDSKTAQQKLASLAAALPSYRDYPINTREHAQASMHKLCVDFNRGGMPALAFAAIYDTIRNAIKRYEAIDWWEQRYNMELAVEAYRFNVKGTAANGQTWEAIGSVECVFGNVFDTVMNATFEMLTDGKAIYGKPGIGCQGPYGITAFHVDKEQQDAGKQEQAAGAGSSPWVDRGGGAE